MLNRQCERTVAGLLLLGALILHPGILKAAESSETTPADTVATANNYLKLSLDGLIAAGGSSADDVTGLQLGSHDPSRNGFSLQNAEIVLSGAVHILFHFGQLPGPCHRSTVD